LACLGLGGVLGAAVILRRHDRGQALAGIDAGASMSDVLQRAVWAAPIGVVVIGNAIRLKHKFIPEVGRK
jgi:hypothetical protein